MTAGEAPGAPVRRIVLLGGESSGKTTLALALAAALGTRWVPEYGRTLWERLRRTLTLDELVHVAERQVQMEEEAAATPEARAAGWLVCDTSPLTTLQYALHDWGGAVERPARLLELAGRRYELVVVCAPDFEFVQDGCRRDDAFRAEQHAWTMARLAAQGVTPLVVTGTPGQRLQRVREALGILGGRIVNPNGSADETGAPTLEEPR